MGTVTAFYRQLISHYWGKTVGFTAVKLLMLLSSVYITGIPKLRKSQSLRIHWKDLDNA